MQIQPPQQLIFSLYCLLPEKCYIKLAILPNKFFEKYADVVVGLEHMVGLEN